MLFGVIFLMTAYLDNSATTPVCGEAVEAMKTAVTELWGNPSSLHQKGIEADEMLENARSNIARRLFCRDDDVYFTSGGTESNNLAVQGAAHAMRRRGRRIVTTSVEHPSIEETVKHLESEGFEVIRLGVDRKGRISERELFDAVTPDTVLVSIMAVNNETGTVQPVEAARTAVTRAKSPALIHCDAVQAFGKLPLKPAAMGVDLMTVSSHKIHGPKGVGALYVKKGVRLSPIVFGGLQEAMPNLTAQLKKVTELRDYMCERLLSLGGVVINSPEDALPYVTNISVLGINSEPMLNFLSSRGVYVSSGSAFSKGYQRS